MLQKQLNISKNILPKIPRFWETPSAAFAELVQNAFRAGASEIHIQVDVEAGKLSVRDNGRGIQSLEDFLIIGDSAWTEEIPDASDEWIGTVGDDIIEPAGMGFYAHFRYAKITTVHNRGRRYRFTSDCLQGALVEIQPFDDAQDKPCDDTQSKLCEESAWTEVCIEGIASKVLAGIDFARMRPLPHAGSALIFTVNGEVVPNMLAEITALETSVGRVYLRHTFSPIPIPSGA